MSRLTLPDGAQWLAEYDHLGRLLRSTDPLGRGERYDYPEGLSPWPHSHIDARGGRQGMLWDSRGLLTAYTDCSGKTTRHDYDADGQLLATTDALGHVTRFERRRTGEPLRVVLPDGSAEVFRYDAAGLLIEQRDNFAQTRTWRRNARGQVLDAGGDAQRHLHYRYDARGRLVELASDTGSRYGFAYDSADRLRLETRPDGVERHLRYDAAGELASLETVGVAAERNGERPRRLAQFERDAMGRLLAHTTATARTRYDWDLGDRLIEAERAPSKAGVALGVEASAVRFDYDVAGRLLAEHGAEGAVAYTLDELDNLTTLSLPHGQRIDTLTYGSGHVHQIRSGERLISDFERDDLHREVQRTQGRLTQRVGYDLLGRRTWQAAGAAGEATGPGQGRLWRSYRYHPSGELAGQSDKLRGDIAFQYDPVLRAPLLSHL